MIYETLTELLAQEIDFVVITLISTKGSVPQNVGAKMVVTKTNTKAPLAGTIGGGNLEQFALAKAIELLNSSHAPSTQLIDVNLTKDLNMSCGGETTLFFEVMKKKRLPIAIFGAGHVAQALIPLLLTLECQISCFDEREEWLNRLPTNQRLKKILTNAPSPFVEELPAETFFIVMTYGHAQDLSILKMLLSKRSDFRYLGVMGSHSKSQYLRSELLKFGINQEIIKRINCPMGLPLGNNDPHEIAISVAAELLTVRDRDSTCKKREEEL